MIETFLKDIVIYLKLYMNNLEPDGLKIKDRTDETALILDMSDKIDHNGPFVLQFFIKPLGTVLIIRNRK